MSAKSQFENIHKYAVIIASIVFTTVVGTVSTISYVKQTVREAVADALKEQKEVIDKHEVLITQLSNRVDNNDRLISQFFIRPDDQSGIKRKRNR